MSDGFAREAFIAHNQQMAEGGRQLTDLGNAERMIQDYGEELRYCANWKKWLIWDGARWRIDQTHEVYHYAKRTVRNMYQTAAFLSNDQERRLLVDHALRSESANRLRAMVEVAGWDPEIAVTPDAMDTDQWVLNVANGQIDLRTGEIHDHDRAAHITKVAPVAYNPEATCPTWERFLYQIFSGDEELISFVQRAIGWCLTGDVSEQALFILYGTGANGKSTFLNTLMQLMGDYGMQTPTETLMAKRGDQVSNDIARLRGTRYVTAIEAEQGRRLAESLIKQLTGADHMTARFLYGEFFDFIPTFKIFLATNHKPVIRGTDYAIWRRVRMVPFETTIPTEKQDRRLGEKLCDEFAGILNWAIAGCLGWQREGLGTVHAVEQATENYRGEMDILASFVTECCEQNPNTMIRARDLFKAYQRWCEDANERAQSERAVGMRLQEMGMDRIRRSDGRYWIGITVKEEHRSPY
jgi:putative DNA primase/helicase